jgi:hypothetical protein
MGNTNGKQFHGSIGRHRAPAPSLRRFTIPFEANVHDVNGSKPGLLQASGARAQIESPASWAPFLTAAHSSSGCTNADVHNVTIRLLVDDGPNLKGTVSWIGSAPFNLPYFRRELDWCINDRMSEIGLCDEEEGWWCTLRAGTVRMGYPRLDDFPLTPVARPARTQLEAQAATTAEELQQMVRSN